MSLGLRLDNALSEVRRQEGAALLLKELMQDDRKQIIQLKKLEQDCKKAQHIIQTVAKATQMQVQKRISKVVTSALEAVFPEPYELCLEFVSKRGRTEAVLSLVRQGGEEKLNPMTATGGGVVDFTAFALRLCVWSMAKDRAHNVFLLDEPFKFVSRDLIPHVGALLREVAERLEIQLIIITHDKAISREADKAYKVELVRNAKGTLESSVSEVEVEED